MTQLNGNTLPHLDIGNRKGWTDYIDFIRPNEFTTSGVQGVDCYRRPFICLKMKCTFDSGETCYRFQTFFRRYTDDRKNG